MKSNTLLVARREFVERVRKRGFILATIGLPVFLLVIWMATGLLDGGGLPTNELPPVDEEMTASGYVDEAGLLEGIATGEYFVAYAHETAAAEALRAGEIEAYYLIEADYIESGVVRRVSQGLPATRPNTAPFRRLLEQGIAIRYDPEMARRLLNPLGEGGPNLILEADEDITEPNDVPERDPGTLDMLPFIVTAIIMVPLFTGGSLLLRSLAEEKESRIMEVLLVSLRPRQLLAGKLLGQGALILLQYLAWIVVGWGMAALTGTDPTMMLQGLQLDAGQTVILLIYALGGFVLYAAIMAGIGAVTPDVHSSQNWVFIITLPMLIPFYLWTALVNAPHSVLSVGLSLFPFSAPMAMVMRVLVTTVPLWQLAVSLVLMSGAIVGIIWAMARLFRAQVLLSGEPLSLGRFSQAFRGR